MADSFSAGSGDMFVPCYTNTSTTGRKWMSKTASIVPGVVSEGPYRVHSKPARYESEKEKALRRVRAKAGKTWARKQYD